MYERDKQKNEMRKQVNKNVEQVVNGNVYGLDKEKLVENALLNLRKALDEPNLSSERILYCCREKNCLRTTHLPSFIPLL